MIKETNHTMEVNDFLFITVKGNESHINNTFNEGSMSHLENTHTHTYTYILNCLLTQFMHNKQRYTHTGKSVTLVFDTLRLLVCIPKSAFFFFFFFQI